MVNTQYCPNCNEVRKFYLLYVREPIPKTKKNKWINLQGFKICSKCGAITLATTLYKDTKRLKDSTFEILDKILIVPKTQEDIDKDNKMRDGISKAYFGK